MSCWYGFTLPPEHEPTWSVRVWPDMCEGVPEARALIGNDSRAGAEPWLFDLGSDSVDERLAERLLKLRQAASGEACWAALEALCTKMMRPYKTDASVSSCLAYLESRRNKDAATFGWWQHFPVGQSLSGMEMDAVRVKMSEYLCLLLHHEVACMLRAFRIDGCFPAAEKLATMLSRAAATGQLL